MYQAILRVVGEENEKLANLICLGIAIFGRKKPLKLYGIDVFLNRFQEANV